MKTVEDGIFSFVRLCSLRLAFGGMVGMALVLGAAEGIAAPAKKEAATRSGAASKPKTPPVAVSEQPHKKNTSVPRNPVAASKKVSGSVPMAPVAASERARPSTPPPHAGKPSGFGQSVFGKKSQKPEADQEIARRVAKAQMLSPKPALKLGNERLSFTGAQDTSASKADHPVKPVNTSLPGKPETIAKFEGRDDDPTAFNVGYRLDDKAAARLAVNQQDESSTTYTPIRKGEGLNAAGVYLDVDVEEDVKLHVGGEVRSNDTGTTAGEDRNSAGASVGMQWSF